ncbi:MAG: hypothetical protein ACLTOG_08650 [Mediterraneibacter faecis]
MMDSTVWNRTFLLLVFTKLAEDTIGESDRKCKIVNLSSNISALITFILAGKIIVGDWGWQHPVLAFAGHYVGAGMDCE